jgi:glycosyltransferase involved in cell wall biosynthesis
MAGGGGRLREMLMSRRLAERGHEVLNISPVVREDLEHVRALPEVGVQSWVALRPDSQPLEALRAVLDEPVLLAKAIDRPVRSLEMAVFWRRLRPLVARAARDFSPDVAIVAHDMSSAWASELPAGLPALLTCHNLNWHLYLSGARQAHGAKALAMRAEAWRYRTHVVRNLPRYHAAVAVSTLERDELERIGATRAVLIPTPVDVDALTPQPEPAPAPARFLLTGTMYYEPNYQGATWFAEHVWPLVRRELPDAQFQIVGKDPHPSVQALDGRDGIEVVGFVPEMAPYFARSNVVVAPIHIGAGIRVKIIESLSAGRATVATTTAWEGLELRPDRDLLVADDPAGFAAACVRLIREPDLRERLARDGRALAERQYDWRFLGDRLEAVLEEAVAAR